MKKFFRGFRFALQGFRFARAGLNFKVQSAVAVFVLAAGLFFRISSLEWVSVVLAIALVLSAEVFNSAIEQIVNFISPGIHPLAGMIKDLAAFAVLLIAIGAFVVGLIIFVPYVTEFLYGTSH